MSQIDLYEIVSKTMSFRIKVDLFEFIRETKTRMRSFYRHNAGLLPKMFWYDDIVMTFCLNKFPPITVA